MSAAQYDLRNLCLYIWLPALWAKPTVKKPSTTLAVIDIALDYQLSVLYGTFLHQGNIGKVLVAFLWLIYKPRWFATMYCMWNKSAQKQFSYESYYQSAHHIMAKPKLWMHRLWQLPKGFKDYAISQGNRSQKFLIEAIITCFFRRSSRSFWEKMSPKLRSTSRTSTLRPRLCNQWGYPV